MAVDKEARAYRESTHTILSDSLEHINTTSMYTLC